ncbi:MAG: tetratricopeptide repeat protein [Nitrospirota bacterium]
MDKKQKDEPLKPHLDGTGTKHLLAIGAIVVFVLIAYSNSLNGTWAMDDIVANRPVAIKDIHDFVGFRKIAYITFIFNQSIAPFSSLNFRLFNILIHVLNTILVYVLAYKTTSRCFPLVRGESKGGGNLAFYAAFISSTIFALHPININAVAYIVQRMASLAAFFSILSLLCYISAVESANRTKAFLFYVSGGILLVAGIFSKENAVMAIPLILLYDYVFLSRFNNKVFMKKVIVIAGLGITSIGLASYFLKLHHAFVDIAKFLLNLNQTITERGWTAIDIYWTPLEQVLTEFRVLSRYLFLILIPLPKFLVFDWWGFPVSRGITEPLTTLLAILTLSSLFLFSLWKIKRYPLFGFAILWYLMAISLESFFAVGSDLYFEHRNYLPLSGLAIGITGQILVSSKGRIKERTLWAIVVVLCIVLGSLTFLRNNVWKDSVTLWGDTLKKVPSNIRAMMSMGNAYLKISELDNAERYYKEVLRISSKDKRTRFLDDSAYSLGMIYLFKGKLEDAKDLIDKFESTIESYRPKILKGFYKSLNNDMEGALKEYNEVINITSGIDKVVVFTLMGDAYRQNGLWDQAIEHYNRALNLDPGFSAAYYGTGVAYMNKRNIEQAAYYFSRTLSLDPHNVLALSDMADLMLIRKSDPEDALELAQRAISNSPPFYQPYLAMANVLIVLGRAEEAEDYYKRAFEHGVSGYMIPFSKARAYYLKGDVEKAEYYLSELKRYKDLPEKIKKIVE